MAYLKLTNIDPNYKEGAPVVINLDYFQYFETYDVYGANVRTTIMNGPTGVSGFLGVDSDNVTQAEVIQFGEELNKAITSAPSSAVVELYTTLQIKKWYYILAEY
jgi:hypothetical protein